VLDCVGVLWPYPGDDPGRISHRMNPKQLFLLLLFFLACARLAVAGPAGTVFTFQGRLSVGSAAATGLYDFQFALYDAATGTNSLGTNTVIGVPVVSGIYTVALDFGATPFDGGARFLDLSVRTNGDLAFTGLTPRQPVTPVPYAIRLTTNVPDSQLSSNIPRLNGPNAFLGPVSFNNSVFVNNSNLIANLNADLLDGLNSTAFAGASHTHVATDIVSGTLGSARLAGTYSNALSFNNPGNVFVGNGVGISGITSTPAGGAGGGLAGNYPNPTIAANAISDSNVSATANINASKILGGDLGAARLKVGTNHTLLASGATIAGGFSNIVDAAATNATIPGGARARASSYGQQAYASGSMATNGDAQASLFIIRNTTTNSTQTELFLDGLGQRIQIPAGANWAVDVVIVARSAGGNNVAYSVSGLIWKEGSNLNSAISIPLVRGSSSSYGPASSADVTVVHDSAHSALVVKVTSPYANSLTRWVATVRTTEVIN